MTSAEERRLARIERDRDRARAALGIDAHGRDVRPPSWLVEADDGDGLAMLGRGEDDVERDRLAEILAAAGLNPDCRDGKHSACAGDAWSDELDRRIACACSCHGLGDE